MSHYEEEELDQTFDELSEEEQEEVMETAETEDWDDLDPDVKEELLVNEGHIEPEEDDDEEEDEGDPGGIPEDFDEWDEEEQSDWIDARGADDFGVDELPEDWDEMDTEEQVEWLDENAPTADPDEGEDEPEEPEGDPLAVSDELPIVEGPGEGRGPVTVAGIDVPGAYKVTQSGAGFESQYLEEDMRGPDYGMDESESDDEGEEPPLTVEIDAVCSSSTMNALVDLRDQEDTFSVSIGDTITLDDMELEDLQREITGDNPYNYEAKIVVQEWREYEVENIMDYFNFEVEDFSIPGAGGGAGGGGTGGDPVNATEAWPENGTEDDPNVITVGGDDSRDLNVSDDEFMEHVILDLTEPGSSGSINTDGGNWEVRDVGVRGTSDNGAPVLNLGATSGNGRADNVYLGEGRGGDAPSAQVSDSSNGNVELARINAPDGIDGTVPTVETSGGSYETIVASGQTITINGGDTFSNTLVDFTSGGSFLVHFTGGGTMRNVGFEGIYRGSGFVVSVNGGGTVEIENVYLGDGADITGDSFTHGPGGFFYHANASANVTIRNVNVQGMTNNGFYYSNTNSGGRVRFESCYGKNNGVSTYRVSDPQDEIINCVAHNDNTDYGPHYQNGITESNGRPVWVWSPGGVTIQNSDFAAGTYPRAVISDGASVNWAGGNNVSGGPNRGGSPNLDPPQGVPNNAQVAASGESGGAPSVPGPDDPDAGAAITISNSYIEGAQVGIRAGMGDGEANIDNANVANSTYGVIAEYGTVNVSNSEIQASEPMSTNNGGEIEEDGTNWGGDASPSMPGSVPMSAEDAAGEVNNDNPGFGGDSTEL